MQAPGEAELLVLWERCLVRHPIDRALLLCAWARPDLTPAQLPDLPLGMLNRSLLELREICFGPHIRAYIDCEHCSERMELTLDTRQLFSNISQSDIQSEFEVSGFRFRLPCSRDLARISIENNIETATLKLLKHCCLEYPNENAPNFAGIMAEAEMAMETLDPATDINLALSCEECGHHWVAELDIGALLWDEIDSRARGLLAEVDSLARAYGWTEPEVLALSAQRRAVYINMVSE